MFNGRDAWCSPEDLMVLLSKPEDKFDMSARVKVQWLTEIQQDGRPKINGERGTITRYSYNGLDAGKNQVRLDDGTFIVIGPEDLTLLEPEDSFAIGSEVEVYFHAANKHLFKKKIVKHNGKKGTVTAYQEKRNKKGEIEGRYFSVHLNHEKKPLLFPIGNLRVPEPGALGSRQSRVAKATEREVKTKTNGVWRFCKKIGAGIANLPAKFEMMAEEWREDSRRWEEKKKEAERIRKAAMHLGYCGDCLGGIKKSPERELRQDFPDEMHPITGIIKLTGQKRDPWDHTKKTCHNCKGTGRYKKDAIDLLRN